MSKHGEKVTKQFFMGILIGLMYGMVIGAYPAFDGLWVETQPAALEQNYE